jgi:drug/metabolite transporter (DMT)-like permease
MRLDRHGRDRHHLERGGSVGTTQNIGHLLFLCAGMAWTCYTVALLLYGRMVSILGATSGAAFLALTPAMTALMGIPILGEFPSAIDWIMIVVISSGVYIVSGGPLSCPDAARAESMRQPIRRTSTASSPTDWRASSR